MRDNDRMRKILTLMVVMVGACGSSGGAEMIGGAGNDGGTRADALVADARAGQDAMALGADVAIGGHDMAPSGADALASRDSQTVKMDTASAYTYCPSVQSRSQCGQPSGEFYRDDAGSSAEDYFGQWKDGYAQVLCTDGTPSHAVAGCLIPSSSVGSIRGAGASLLCASACDGCYRDRGATCGFGAGCCAPLTCVGGACQ